MTGQTKQSVWAGLKYFTDVLTGCAFVRCLDRENDRWGRAQKLVRCYTVLERAAYEQNSISNIFSMLKPCFNIISPSVEYTITMTLLSFGPMLG